jgi:L-glutamine-phosphate cytidylyltransferase
MKAIIVAAGRGRRLGVETDAIPKCMVRVAGRPILHWQLDAFAAAGVDEVIIVRGYLGDRIAPTPGMKVRYVDNPDWASNNILTSLFYAEAEMAEAEKDGGFLFSYSDIVFAPEHARRLAETSGAVALVIDRLWRDAYEGRTLHPVSEAELARVEGLGDGARVARVGKRLVSAEDAAGEFIGLARFAPAGSAALRALWREILPAGLSQSFGAAASLAQAYLTDGLNGIAERGVPLVPSFIDGRWREIDTEQDLARAEVAVTSWGW